MKKKGQQRATATDWSPKSRGSNKYTSLGTNIYVPMVTENLTEQTYTVDSVGSPQAYHPPARTRHGGELEYPESFHISFPPIHWAFDPSATPRRG